MDGFVYPDFFIYTGEPGSPGDGSIDPNLNPDPISLPGPCIIGEVDPVTGDTWAGCGNGDEVPSKPPQQSNVPAWLAYLGTAAGSFLRAFLGQQKPVLGTPPVSGRGGMTGAQAGGINWMLVLLIALVVVALKRK